MRPPSPPSPSALLGDPEVGTCIEASLPSGTTGEGSEGER